MEQGIAQRAVLVLYQGRVTASPGSSPGPDMVPVSVACFRCLVVLPVPVACSCCLVVLPVPVASFFNGQAQRNVAVTATT